MLTLRIVFITAFALISGCGGQDPGTPFEIGQPYVRAVFEDNSSGRLKMSAKTFVPLSGEGPKVTLMGMIHIGESDFYKNVQDKIDGADLVLFESIGNPYGDSYSATAFFAPACRTLFGMTDYTTTASALRLSNQYLQYPHERSIWADLSLEGFLDQFLRTEFANGLRRELPNGIWDSKCYQLLWLINKGIKAQPDHEFKDIDFLADPSIVASKLRNITLSELTRRAIAEGVATLSERSEYFPGFREVLIERRNDVVLHRLRDHLNFGGGEILIVYGAAHMPDIEARFTKQFNYVPDRERLLTAFEF
ncbi:MAG: hypothetical protein V4534_02055 [Myxococcota bacterium]